MELKPFLERIHGDIDEIKIKDGEVHIRNDDGWSFAGYEEFLHNEMKLDAISKGVRVCYKDNNFVNFRIVSGVVQGLIKTKCGEGNDYLAWIDVGNLQRSDDGVDYLTCKNVTFQISDSQIDNNRTILLEHVRMMVESNIEEE